MRIEQIGDCALYLADCMDVLPTLRKVDAVVTDPPYGIGKKMQGGGGSISWAEQTKKMLEWDLAPPEKSLFDLMLSKAQNSIIWGGNYFELPPSRAFLVWDKGGSMRGRSFAECEQAWCSWDGNARIKTLTPPTHGGKEIKEHATQKPIELMKWCISHLPGNAQTILDPFMGSGTTGVACVKMGRKFIGIERDQEYFDIACRRIREAYAQPDMFIEPAKQMKQEILI